MKKLIFGLATAVAMMFAIQSNAQESVGSAGIELAIPVGDFGKSANFGFGVSGQYEYGLTRNIALNLNAGVIFYAMEYDGYSFTHVPIQVGARYYLEEQRDGLFFGVRLGVHIGISKIDEIDLGFGTVGGGSNSEANFSFAPEAGYYITENISLALRYQLVFGDGSNLGYLGLRAAYSF